MIENKKYKLAILISHPIQYHTPLFQALAKHPQIDLTVFYCWDFGVDKKSFAPEFGVAYKWDIPLLDGYKHKFLRNFSLRPSDRFWGQINPGIVKEVWTGRYDVLWVHGYSFFTDWLAFLAAKLRGTPIFIRGVTHILDEKPWYVRLVKKIILPILFGACAACLYIGENNKRYYEYYGVSREKLFFVPHVVGNDFFQGFYEKLEPKRAEIRKRFGFSGDHPIILFAGKLIPKKRPLWVLEVYRKIRGKHACGLLFAGEGPLRKDIESEVEKYNIPDVRITGFLNQTEMPRAYIAGDVLVLPSAYGETWGLVVNEAMNFGLPIIVSDKVGCGPDLVFKDKNGFIISSREELYDALLRLISDEGMLRNFGKKSKEIIASYDIIKATDGALEALRKIA